MRGSQETIIIATQDSKNEGHTVHFISKKTIRFHRPQQNSSFKVSSFSLALIVILLGYIIVNM